MNVQNGGRPVPNPKPFDQYPNMKQLSRYSNFGKTLEIVKQQKNQEASRSRSPPSKFQNNFKSKLPMKPKLPRNEGEKLHLLNTLKEQLRLLETKDIKGRDF
jgi:hypothetical protein